MVINSEILRSMNYVRETSYRTNPTPDYISTDYQRDKELFALDYSNLKCQRTNLTDDNF